jgi:carboxypeptidase T
MKTKRFLIVLAILLISLALASGAMAGFWQSSSMPDPLTSEPLPEGDELWVVRIYYENQEQLIELTSMFAPWEVHPDRGYLVVDVDLLEYNHLLRSSYRVEVDEKLTELLNKPNEPLPGQISGIPGYPCYRTVEETYATAEQIVANYPHLSAWIDIGDSWEKITPGGEPGYDIMVLRLTNENTNGDKAKIFIMAAVHAREYTTAELATRFAEYLVENYDTDPEVTWILDHNEVHIVLQANPDGRKKAEAGLSWRKNTNNNYCANTNNRGADLNRNFPYLWGGQGGSPSPCDATYRGPWAASEPETQAIIDYVREYFPDNREDDEYSPAPVDAMGIFLDLHSYSQLVLWPWGHVYNPAPNGTALQTLGRKFAYFNNYTPQQSVYLYPTTGTTDDFGYGELGLASYTFELGNFFFESCSAFESTIFPNNMPALLYAATATRLPYMEPAGPDPLDVAVYPSGAAPGEVVRISAVLDDTRFNNSQGTEPVQNIVEAEYYINLPPWDDGAVAFPMTPVDGSFNSPVEAVEAYLDTSGLEQGRYMIFVRGKDAADNWGVVSAAFFTSLILNQRLSSRATSALRLITARLKRPSEQAPSWQ